jgi:hypothetical protein
MNTMNVMIVLNEDFVFLLGLVRTNMIGGDVVVVVLVDIHILVVAVVVVVVVALERRSPCCCCGRTKVMGI